MVNKTIRKMDEIGRIVIPREVRLALNLSTEDNFEVTVKNGAIILRKAREEK